MVTDRTFTFTLDRNGYRAYAINVWEDGGGYYDFYINRIGEGNLYHCYGLNISSPCEIETYLELALSNYTSYCC